MIRYEVLLPAAGPIPPVHGKDMDICVVRQPPGKLEVPNLIAAAMVRIDRVGYQCYDRLSLSAHPALPLCGTQAVRKSIDSAGLSSCTTKRNWPLTQAIDSFLVNVAVDPEPTLAEPVLVFSL